MKKFFYFALAALMSFAATMSLTSCGDDEKDDIQPSNEFKSAEVVVSYEFSEDVLQIFDLTINVTDFDGKTKSVEVSKAGQQSFTTTSKNGVLNVNFGVKGKEGFTPENRSYELNWKMYMASTVYYQNGEKEYYSSSVMNNTQRYGEGKLTSDNLPALYTRHEGTKVYTMTLKDGEFVRE